MSIIQQCAIIKRSSGTKQMLQPSLQRCRVFLCTFESPYFVCVYTFFLYVHVVACCCSTVRVLRAYNHHCSCKLRLWWPGECSCFGVDRTEIFMACAILCFIWAHLRLFRSVNLESRKKHKHKHTHNDQQQTVTETTQSWGKNRPKFVIKIMEQLFSAHLSLRFFMIYFWTDNK